MISYELIWGKLSSYEAKFVSYEVTSPHMSSYELIWGYCFSTPSPAQAEDIFFLQGQLCSAVFSVPFFRTADASPFAGPNAGQALFAGPKAGETPSLLRLSSLGLHLMPALRRLLSFHFRPIQCPCSFNPHATRVSWWVCRPLWLGSLAIAFGFSPSLCWVWLLGSWQGGQEEMGWT